MGGGGWEVGIEWNGMEWNGKWGRFDVRRRLEQFIEGGTGVEVRELGR